MTYFHSLLVMQCWMLTMFSSFSDKNLTHTLVVVVVTIREGQMVNDTLSSFN